MHLYFVEYHDRYDTHVTFVVRAPDATAARQMTDWHAEATLGEGGRFARVTEADAQDSTAVVGMAWGPISVPLAEGTTAAVPIY